MNVPRALFWEGDAAGFLRLLDQTRLPADETWVACRDVETVHDAIRTLAVRGAPAIGIAAAYGVFLAARGDVPQTIAALRKAARRGCDHLRTARPTAVNLFWALDRMEAVLSRLGNGSGDGAARGLHLLFEEARAIHAEDEATCRRIGEVGVDVVPQGARILTHCNAGALATGGIGTALAAVYCAHEAGKAPVVYVDETRPLLQGARITAWELSRAGIPVTLLCDGAAGSLLFQRKVDLVIVGADRIARNGDVANKIGTYPLSVLARAHGIPFYVAAPFSSFDLRTRDGREIPIESRAADEVISVAGCRTAPDGIDVYNPAFDVTPAENVTALITPAGLIQRPDEAAVVAALEGAGVRG